MKYELIQVPDFLKGHVRFIWTLDSQDMPHKFKTVADGSPGLIFQHTSAGTFQQNEKLLPPTFLYGQATTHAEISMGKATAIGICFHPNALKSIFGLNADELTDDCIDLNVLEQKQHATLTERLLNTENTTQRIELLSNYLAAQIERNKHTGDSLTTYVLSRMIHSKGSVPLKELQRQLQLSERSFERRFKQEVGVSPKLFARICGFQASLNQLHTNNYDKLSDIAYDNGYADQSHFIRTFKEFTGSSPFRYQKQGKPLTANFPELVTPGFVK